ncbi:23S rRNA (pseudouridine(1915)-N(3))-methyltransferase RlmH [soil metagenome]
MRMSLIATGVRMSSWVEQGFHEYVRRLPREFALDLREIRPGPRSRTGDANRARAVESARMLAIAGTSRIVALDPGGRLLDSAGVAALLHQWREDGRDVALLVGGPDGLDLECLSRAEFRWSLSPLIFPHALVRIVVAEQLYRATTLLRNHPYHRG